MVKKRRETVWKTVKQIGAGYVIQELQAVLVKERQECSYIIEKRGPVVTEKDGELTIRKRVVHRGEEIENFGELQSDVRERLQDQ